MLKNKKIFFLCFAFLLTKVSFAETSYFNEAQNFFYESKKAVKNYLKTGKGLNEKSIQRAPSQSFKENNLKESLDQNNKFQKSDAAYFSLISQTIKDSTENNPDYSLSLGVSIPVVSNFKFLNSEFQFSGDIKNAGDWGQLQFLHKEILPILRLNDFRLEFFLGMGFGYGYGDLIDTKNRFYAPWATGFQWNKIYRKEKLFHRFELGMAGDVYFGNSSYNRGLFANLSIGYKL